MPLQKLRRFFFMLAPFFEQKTYWHDDKICTPQLIQMICSLHGNLFVELGINMSAGLSESTVRSVSGTTGAERGVGNHNLEQVSWFLTS